MTYYRPQPKKKPVRLKGKAYTRLRWDAFDRAGGFCEVILPDGKPCNVWAPFRQGGVILGELSHIVHRSRGGSDTLDNVLWSCMKCHRQKHGPQWSKGKNEVS